MVNSGDHEKKEKTSSSKLDNGKECSKLDNGKGCSKLDNGKRCKEK